MPNPIWVVSDPNSESDGEPMCIYAASAQDAANQIVGSGDYDWAPEPPNWNTTKSQRLTAEDADGGQYEVDVWGPFPAVIGAPEFDPNENMVQCAVMKTTGRPVNTQLEADVAARLVNPTAPRAEAVDDGVWLLNFPPELWAQLEQEGSIELNLNGYHIEAEMP